MPPAGSSIGVDRSASALCHPAQVHVKDVVPVIKRVRVYLTADSNAGIVEQVRRSARIAASPRRQRVRTMSVAHIELDCVRLAAPTGAGSGRTRARRRSARSAASRPQHPCRPASVANAAPMPDAPPVTNAILPATLDAIAKGYAPACRPSRLVAADASTRRKADRFPVSAAAAVAPTAAAAASTASAASGRADSPPGQPSAGPTR